MVLQEVGCANVVGVWWNVIRCAFRCCNGGGLLVGSLAVSQHFKSLNGDGAVVGVSCPLLSNLDSGPLSSYVKQLHTLPA